MNKGEKTAYVVLMITIALVILAALAGMMSVFRNGAGEGYTVYTPGLLSLVCGVPVLIIEFIVYLVMRKKKK